MEAVFQAPQRRTRVYESYEAPFPVPRTEEEARRSEERVYRAELVNQHVLVRDPKHIQELHGRGYFGKGILSRARPDHSISRYWEEYGDRHLPVISHSKYEQQLSWARGALLAQGMDEEAVNQTLLRLSQPVKLEDLRKGAGGGENGHKEEEKDEGKDEENDVCVSSEGESDRDCTQRKRLQSGSDSDPAAPAELHPEKGGLGRDCTQRKRLQSGSDSEPAAPAELHPEKGGLGRDCTQRKRLQSGSDSEPAAPAELHPEKGGLGRDCTQRKRLQSGSDSEPAAPAELHPEKGGLGRDCTQRKRLQSGSDSEPAAPAEPYPDEGGRHRENPQAKRPRRQGDLRFDPLAELHPEEPEQVDQQAKCPRHDDWIIHCGCRWHPDPKPAPKPAPAPAPELLEPGCEYVLVADDRQDGGQVERDERTEVRLNPFRLIEYLQLSLEEAFFLVYALGCLSVYHNEEPLTIIQLWRTFRSVQPSFDSSYAAYHYYRSRGWVPKPGLKYGSDLMLYRKGPPFYHASYSVAVERVGEAFRGTALRPFTWRSLAALSRITGNVSKELMLCYIIYPADLSDVELSSPLCLDRLSVQEVIVSRWISSRERAEQDDI